MFPDHPSESVNAAIDRVAEQALWEAGLGEPAADGADPEETGFRGPPVDAFRLAERRGDIVAEDGFQQGRARRMRMPGDGERAPSGAILLAPEPRPERRQWAVAHEVGESLAYDVFVALGERPDDAPPAAREWVANRLASALLLPRGWFAADVVATDADLLELKRRYRTASHELIARRWLEVCATSIVVTVADNGKVTWRRSNFSPRRLPLLADERACWLAAHERGEPVVCEPEFDAANGVARVRAWPVHEEGWRREILLSELAAEW